MGILMTVLKAIFVVLLCVPVAYVASALISRLIDEFVRQQKEKRRNR